MSHTISEERLQPGSAREQVCEAPALPPSLAQRLRHWQWRRNRVGQAGAAVYRLHKPAPNQQDLYLKQGRGEVAEALFDEAARLRWLGQALPTNQLLGFEWDGEEAWLLSAAVPGRSAYECLRQRPEQAAEIAQALGAFLARLHALPIEACAFNAQLPIRLAQARRRLEAGLVDAQDFDADRAGQTAEQVWLQLQALLPMQTELVLTHGDYSLDNILLDEAGEVSGVIDLGRLGVADRYQDLAIAWNCLQEFGSAAQQAFVSAYGIPSPDPHKIALHLCLDEFF
ncbi:APH(3') family aminoglycoside O-phosphotransferase [Paucibacter sp. KBW04]|uniref:APH(3') family aminoglycoside O-phosphotransferase n=1 Tax=Paucibacter sp. KBW04 TaxID=2153361 RepID=UPI001E43584E|nr:APH(3') family aminoglycoside O-phosphotransferase [Paucibacter sp. KBW04]